MKITSFEEFKELARRGTFVPVCKEIVADLLTPVSAFLKIAEHADYAFLLESVEGGEHVGRYSFLGKDPFLILKARDGKTTIDRSGAVTESDRPFIETLYQFACAKIQFLERELERNLSKAERPARNGLELTSNHTREAFEAHVR